MAYSSTLGRWVHGDPKGYVDGANLYEYVKSSPTRFTDPFGTQATAPATEPVWKFYKGEKGEWAITVSPNSVRGRKSLPVNIVFFPSENDDKCGPCKTIKFIQLIRFSYGFGDEVVHPLSRGTAKHPQLQTARDDKNGIEPGWMIDFEGSPRNAAGKPEVLPAGKPVPVFYTDHFGSGTDKIGYKDPTKDPKTQLARMGDAPELAIRPGAKFEAQTYAICVDTGEVLGGLVGVSRSTSN